MEPTTANPSPADTGAAPNVPSTAAPAPASPSSEAPTIGAEIDAMFGYRAPLLERDDESPSRETPDDAAAGAPPAPSSAAPTSGTSTTDQPAPDALDASQSTIQAAPDAPDPLQDATPLTYVVSGQERADEKIRVIPELGAFIAPEDLPYLQQRLSERDHLFESSRAQFERLSQLEALTSWPKRDDRGQIIGSITGREAIEAARIDYGAAIAKLEAYERVLNDPAQIAALLTYDADQGTLTLDADAKARIDLAIENRRLKLIPAIRSHLASLGGGGGSAPGASPATSGGQMAAPNVAPATIVELAIAHGQITGLTDADQTWAQQIAPRYVRTATAEDVRANPMLTVGAPVLDPEFVALLRDRASLRAESARTAAAAATAAASNAPKLAAALMAGRGAPPRGPAPAVRPAAPSADELSEEEQAFAQRERAAAAALRVRAS